MHRQLTVGLLLAGWALAGSTVLAEPALRLVETRKIWDRAPHNAFTDLARFQGQWYCVFREGTGHVSPDGALRVLRSSDGAHWEPATRLADNRADLRDPKITLTPDGRLMLSAAGALRDTSRGTHQSYVWFSPDGTHWSQAYPIGDPDYWLWRITWHEGIAYAVGYHTVGEPAVRLYRSEDGRHFETLVDNLVKDGQPNESSIVFDDDQAYLLLRRDGPGGSALLGLSRAPYTEWEWKDLGVRIGGPCMVQLQHGELLAAARLYEPRVRTSLCWIDPQSGTLDEALTLPSGGDTSYAGMGLDGDSLLVSYYSSHEGKASIYVARVAIDAGGK